MPPLPMRNSLPWSEQFFFSQDDESVTLSERDKAEDTRGRLAEFRPERRGHRRGRWHEQEWQPPEHPAYELRDSGPRP